ncbi:MAG TPA: TfoX/Sxy family protein [Acidiferrobacterales bacterium]|nr:TfoX/Sxy family protein [Acidiferrobacterales bacterium]
MAVSKEYRDYILERLECAGPAVGKNMFGGVGIYLQGLFFALIAEDVLYFKVDDSNRPDYSNAGMEAFKPYGDRGQVMQYYQVPIEILEDDDNLRIWINKALTVAGEKSKAKKKGLKRRN